VVSDSKLRGRRNSGNGNSVVSLDYEVIENQASREEQVFFFFLFDFNY